MMYNVYCSRHWFLMIITFCRLIFLIINSSSFGQIFGFVSELVIFFNPVIAATCDLVISCLSVDIFCRNVLCFVSISLHSITYFSYRLFIAQCTLVHMRGLGIACRPSVRLSVRPSVRPSVCNVGGL